jgi:HPt (histidine-containing phosphotransfer) domain-containing protein
MSEFDINKVLKLVDNDKEMATILLQMFVEQSKKDFNTLLTAKNNNDVAMIGKMAHKMKSSLATLGITNTAEQLKKIEYDVKAGNSISELLNDINIVSEQLDKVYKDIQNII